MALNSFGGSSASAMSLKCFINPSSGFWVLAVVASLLNAENFSGGSNSSATSRKYPNRFLFPLVRRLVGFSDAGALGLGGTIILGIGAGFTSTGAAGAGSFPRRSVCASLLKSRQATQTAGFTFDVCRTLVAKATCCCSRLRNSVGDSAPLVSASVGGMREKFLASERSSPLGPAAAGPWVFAAESPFGATAGATGGLLIGIETAAVAGCATTAVFFGSFFS